MKKIHPKAREIYAQSVDAFVRYLQRTSVCILGHDGSDPNTIGSGICVKINDRFLIATAGHVIKDHSSEHLAIFTLVNKGTYSVVVARHFLIDASESIDLGFLELDSDFAKSSGLNFVDESSLGLTGENLTSEIIAIYGFPEKRVIKPGPKHYLLSPLTYTTQCNEPAKWHNGVIENREIELEYPEGVEDAETRKYIELPDAPGMSGGGVWILNVATNKNVWAPECAKIAGVLTNWHKTERWVRANRIQGWLNFVKEKLP